MLVDLAVPAHPLSITAASVFGYHLQRGGLTRDTLQRGGRLPHAGQTAVQRGAVRRVPVCPPSGGHLPPLHLVIFGTIFFDL